MLSISLLFFFFYFVLVLVFSSMVSPVSGTHSIEQASLEFIEICLPLPGIKGMKYHTRLVFLKMFQTVKGLWPSQIIRICNVVPSLFLKYWGSHSLFFGLVWFWYCFWGSVYPSPGWPWEPTTFQRLSLNSWSSCFHLLDSRITGICHYPGPVIFVWEYLNKFWKCTWLF